MRDGAAVTCHGRTHAGQWDAFDVLAHPAFLERASDDLRDVDFLTDQREGVGTVFACVRQSGDRVERQVVEIAEYEPDRLVRYLAAAGPHLWDITFRLTSEVFGTTVEMSVVARSTRAARGVLAPVDRAMCQADLDGICRYCDMR